MLACLLFRYCPSSLPEEQYRSGLWAQLIRGFLIYHIGAHELSFKYEYRIQSFEPSYALNQRVDIAVASNTLLGEIPILLCEVSGHPTGEYDHKDYQKLANEMHAVLWRTVELCKQGEIAPESMGLIVYGLYVSALDFQVCTMRPVFEVDANGASASGRFVAIFQTENHWKFSLTQTIGNCDENCPPCNSYQLQFSNMSINEDEIARPSCEDINDESLKEAYDNVDILEPQNEATENEDSSNSQHRDLQNLDLKQILPGLAQLSLIFDEVSVYGKCIAAKLEKGKKNGSRKTKPYPSYLRPQSSRSSNSSSTPYKGRPASGNVGVKGSGKGRQKTRAHFLEIQGTACVIIRKRKSLNEIEMLKKLCGSMHVVELFHSYAYSLLDEMVLFEEALEPMEPYKQIPDCLNYPSLIHGYCIQFLLDSISALIFLKKHRIIHRDISARNVMFSPFFNVWKLIDFETAISLSHDDDNGVCKEPYNGGTRAYSAPEFSQNESYDYSVDAYSLGRVYLQALDSDIVVYAVTDTNADKLSISLCNVASGLAKKEKSKRMPLEVANERLLKLLPEIRDFYREESFDTEQPDILDFYPRLNHYLGLAGLDNFPSRNRIALEIERRVKDYGLYYIPEQEDGDIEAEEEDEVGGIASKENVPPSNYTHSK